MRSTCDDGGYDGCDKGGSGDEGNDDGGEGGDYHDCDGDVRIIFLEDVQPTWILYPCG